MNKKLSHLLSKIKDKIDLIIIAAGSFLVAYNLLDFQPLTGYNIFSMPFNKRPVHAWGYCYNDNARFWFATGICLIVWGVLLHKNKK